ncbi:O-methyltransferase-domain-containing protein [Desarmillaria tabescens]|uniref:O-methyltransferase-domain-containing protein n=1 Tax=Armillaria tabescens TaxID=1929756 RepID=A0AA39KE36_ARMTA|nr:O-methyltransferase-domain-containing protein [Desarmillaria tabescens]KAK0459415.1 O-methyltransferase-domain-containing protein [Desarmillaria tabescens]
MAAVLNKTLPPTTLADWERSDKYHNSHLLQNDETLEAALQNSEANGLPVISVSPAQGKFLYLLAKSIGAKRILEVCSARYSAIHFARALPDDGKVTTLELEERLCQGILKKAGVASKIQIIVGPALDSLQKMPSEPNGGVANPADNSEIPTGATMRSEATTISTVGEKGYDGFLYAIRK